MLYCKTIGNKDKPSDTKRSNLTDEFADNFLALSVAIWILVRNSSRY